MTAEENPAVGRLRQSLAPLRSWQPQEIGPSGYRDHLAVLAWLVFTLRPRQGIGLGIGQGVAYFALCQAVRDAGLDAQLFGIGQWPAQQAGALRDHNQQDYAAFSRLVSADPDGAADIFDFGGIDLLMVDQDLTPELLGALTNRWLPLMSERGVIVLRGLTAAREEESARTKLAALTGAMPHLELSGGDGVAVLLVGAAPDETLALAAELAADEAGQTALAAEFAGLAAPVQARIAAEEDKAQRKAMAQDLARLRKALAEATGARDTALTEAAALRARLAELQDSQQTAIAALALRDGALAERARELEEARAAMETRTGALERSRAEVLAMTRVTEEVHAQLERLRSEHETALAREAERRRLDASLTARLTAGRTEAQAALQAAQAILAQKDAEILALRSSTSWKVTAPLRNAKKAITGQ